MTARSVRLYIEDMLEAMTRIERYTRGMTFEQFEETDQVVDAVIRNLQVIGEAARSIPEEVRQASQEIPWRRMIGLRNITVHQYFGVDLNIIWEIVNRNLPETRPLIVKMLDESN